MSQRLGDPFPREGGHGLSPLPARGKDGWGNARVGWPWSSSVSVPLALGGTVRLEQLGFWVSFGCDGSGVSSPPSGQGWLHPKPAGYGPTPYPASRWWVNMGHPQGVRSWWGEQGCGTTRPAAPIAPTKPLAAANPFLNVPLVPPLCLSFPFHMADLCPASPQPPPLPRLRGPAGWLPGEDLGPVGDPGGTAIPFAHRVLLVRQSRWRNAGLGGSGSSGQAVLHCGGSWGGSSPRQWDGVSGAGRHIQPYWDTTMELLWVLLALAGTGAAAGMGDSRGVRGRGGRGFGGAVRCFPCGFLQGICGGEGVMGLGMAGGSSRWYPPPGAGTAGTP